MSVEIIGLSKLLSAMYAKKQQRTAMLRRDILQEIRKLTATKPSKGGDFYIPFWADAKRHVAGDDLRILTPARMASNETRERLYPLLRDGFLSWWEEKRRQKNEPFTVLDEQVKARLALPGLGTVKVENILWFRVGDDGDRIVYPYFCQDPQLSSEAARLGLWAMSQCIQGHDLETLRILDVIAGRSFSILDTPLLGTEESSFLAKYSELVTEWKTLRQEYP